MRQGSKRASSTPFECRPGFIVSALACVSWSALNAVWTRVSRGVSLVGFFYSFSVQLSVLDPATGTGFGLFELGSKVG